MGKMPPNHPRTWAILSRRLTARAAAQTIRAALSASGQHSASQHSHDTNVTHPGADSSSGGALPQVLLTYRVQRGHPGSGSGGLHEWGSGRLSNASSEEFSSRGNSLDRERGPDGSHQMEAEPAATMSSWAHAAEMGMALSEDKGF